MSIRTTITLDEDVVERVRRESRSRGASFRETLNDLLRIALVHQEKERPVRRLIIEPISMGYRSDLNNDDIEGLIEYGEGPEHK